MNGALAMLGILLAGGALAGLIAVDVRRHQARERAAMAHKAVHPSRWGEGKRCECGQRTRLECSTVCEKDIEDDGGP